MLVVLFLTILLLPSIHGIQCSSNSSLECKRYCYQNVNDGTTGCLEDLEVLPPDFTCPFGTHTYCYATTSSEWYEDNNILYACNSTDCLKDAKSKFPIPKMRYDFYSMAIFYICGTLSLLLVTILGVFPLSYRLYAKRKNQKLTESGLNPELDPELFKNIWPQSITKHKDTVATGLIPLEETDDALKEIEKYQKMDRTKSDHVPDPDLKITFERHYVYKKGGHKMVTFARQMPSKYETLLFQMLEHGPGSFALDAIEINEVLDLAHNMFSAEASLVEINAPCIVIGELDASYPDIFRWLQVLGFPGQKKLIFAGGVFDSTAAGAIETLALVAALKVALPFDVFVIKGAKEMVDYHFPSRFGRNVSNGLGVAVNRMFSQLPLAVLVEKKILVVHSGISTKMRKLETIINIRRPITISNLPDLAQDLIYSIPTLDSPGRRSFTEDTVYQVCEDLNLELIIRARGRSAEGHFTFANQRMLSIFSKTSMNEHEKGCAVTIEPKGIVRLHTIEDDSQLSPSPSSSEPTSSSAPT
ncbi:unnamed protein product [Bursaphelenchus okinawaensis]|uniref:Serine/threonine specific protein phosphatases domain-containing protein n=1 Tax=Bursaphelenchus okinawaensis TaxID=465554 RepID=A0A811LCG3_9BILA|nr:unnamed protein product [Bursaphelenchus okinawaensis]CAG9120350.1 unnamed protein product [Bursaphelenchus okinawaensis]